MKVCSFIPAVTQMIYDLGLQEYLCGVTFECPERARQDHPVLVRSRLQDAEYSSAEIDRIFAESKRSGQSLYYVDEAQLQSIRPDLIFTQDVCTVCQIDTATTQRAVSGLEYSPQLVAVSPDTLQSVFDSVGLIARLLQSPASAIAHLDKLQKRLQRVAARVSAAPPRRVFFMEWMDPIFQAGHWIPEQLRAAGAQDELSRPGKSSSTVSWEEVRRYDPEVLIIAPCGFSVAQSLQEMETLTQKAGWSSLRAVQSNAVFLAQADLFTQPSAANLVEGIELLSDILHGDIDSGWSAYQVYRFSQKSKQQV